MMDMASRIEDEMEMDAMHESEGRQELRKRWNWTGRHVRK